MFGSKDELIEYIEQNKAFTIKDIAVSLGCRYLVVKDTINRKLKFSVIDYRKKRIVDFYKQGYNRKYIQEYFDCHRATVNRAIYDYKQSRSYKRLRKSRLIAQLEKYDFVLYRFKKSHNLEPKTVMREINEYGLLSWFYEERLKTESYKKYLSIKRTKRGDSKRILEEFFEKYPIAVNKSVEEISAITGLPESTVCRLRRKYKDLSKVENTNIK